MSNGVAFEIVGTGGVTVQSIVPGPPMLNMALWYIADNVSGVDGDPVALLPDSSGNNLPATQTDPTKQPVLKTGTNGINGHAVVQTSVNAMSPSDTLVSYLSADIDPAVYSGLSVYYVARTHSSTTPTGGVFGWGAFSGSWFNAALGNDAAQGAGWAGATGGVGLGAVVGIAANAVYYASYRYDKTRWTLDGINTGTVADTAFPTGPEVALIGSNTYPNSQSEIDIAEIIVYAEHVSDDVDATIKAYLQAKYGLPAAVPSPIIEIGYPDTIINNFAVRYVHPAGNDENDGKRWETAKATVLAAYDDLATGHTVGTIYIHDGSYVGGEVSSQGIWLYSEDTFPGVGWRAFKNTRFIGVGGLPPGSFGRSQARIFPGKPGDSQAFDLTKPLIWAYGMETELLFKDIQPGAQYGFARLGVTASGSRDGLVSNLTMDGVAMSSPPDTAASFGPCYDCGWLNICWFRRCNASGSSVYHDVVVDPADNVNGGTRTWVFNNGVFTSDHVGGWLVVAGAANPANNGQMIIASVIDAHTITTTAGRSPVAETFSSGTVTLQVAWGPSVLQDDDHAGWLFKPNIDGAGGVGTMGQVYFDEIYPTAAGIKYNVGAQGFGLSVRQLLSENGPMPHPIQIDVVSGTNVGAIGFEDSRLIADGILMADTLVADPYLVYINPLLWAALSANNINVTGVEGVVYGPGQFPFHNDNFLIAQPTTPWRMGQVGIFRNGRLSARTDAGRRLGAPAVALPVSASNTSPTNSISHDPDAWTANGGATLTPNTLDVFGLQNACDMAANTGSMTLGTKTTILSDGDFVLSGVWCRAPGAFGLDTPIMITSPTNGSFVGVGRQFVNGNWLGNGEWVWGSAVNIYKTPGGIPASDTLIASANASSFGASRLCYPVLLILKLADGWTDTEAWELMAHMATWNPELAQGVVGTLRNQPFVGHGGLGIASSLPKTVGSGSGQLTLGSVLSYEPRFAEDGTTIIGWVPIYAATVNP
jgi:hypothetical protein